MDSNVIQFNSASKRFKRFDAVTDVTFGVPEGSCTALIGPNGAGKTTLMRMALGLARPTSGSALVFGSAYKSLKDPVKSVGVSLDSFRYEPGISARRQLQIMAVAAGVPFSRVDSVLDQLGLAHSARKSISSFSTGMMQRFRLASAILASPTLLILDEPTNGLDPEGLRWFRSFVSEFLAAGGTIMYSAHQLDEVERLCDRVVVLSRRVLFDGSPAELLKRQGEPSIEEAYFDLLESCAE